MKLIYTILLPIFFVSSCKEEVQIPEKNDHKNIDKITVGNFIISISQIPYERSELTIFKNEELSDTLYHSKIDGGFSNYTLSEPDLDNAQYLILEFTGNRQCNYVISFESDTYTILDDCRKFPNLTAVKLDNQSYFASYENKGCASGLWNTKLLKFNKGKMEIIYDAEIDECEEYIILIKNLSQEFKLSADILPQNRNLEAIWRILLGGVKE